MHGPWLVCVKTCRFTPHSIHGSPWASPRSGHLPTLKMLLRAVRFASCGSQSCGHTSPLMPFRVQPSEMSGRPLHQELLYYWLLAKQCSHGIYQDNPLVF